MSGASSNESQVPTVERFWRSLRHSGLFSAEDVAALRAEKSAGTSATVELADELVADELLTRWQANQLLKGNTTVKLGGYTLLDCIGSGNMGSVYRADSADLGIVAIKVVSPSAVNSTESFARFQREVRAATELDHPNLIRAYGSGRVDNIHFLVMEYYPGKDLKHWIDEQKRFTVDVACACISQAARGLGHALQHGMVHRDVKPANMLASRSQTGSPAVVKVLDLGLARFLSDTSSSRLTATGQLIGTPDYISPEQAKAPKQADTRSDVFSLGVSLFEFLAGELPFKGENNIKKMMVRLSQDAPPIRSVRPELPQSLEAIVAKMLARDVDDRYQTPGEVADALSPFAQGAIIPT